MLQITALETQQVLFFSDAMHPGRCRHCKNGCVSRTNSENSDFSVNITQSEEFIASVDYSYHQHRSDIWHPHEKWWIFPLRRPTRCHQQFHRLFLLSTSRVLHTDVCAAHELHVLLWSLVGAHCDVTMDLTLGPTAGLDINAAHLPRTSKLLVQARNTWHAVAHPGK